MPPNPAMRLAEASASAWANRMWVARRIRKCAEVSSFQETRIVALVGGRDGCVVAVGDLWVVESPFHIWFFAVSFSP